MSRKKINWKWVIIFITCMLFCLNNIFDGAILSQIGITKHGFNYCILLCVIAVAVFKNFDKLIEIEILKQDNKSNLEFAKQMRKGYIDSQKLYNEALKMYAESQSTLAEVTEQKKDYKIKYRIYRKTNRCLNKLINALRKKLVDALENSNNLRAENLKLTEKIYKYEQRECCYASHLQRMDSLAKEEMSRDTERHYREEENKLRNTLNLWK